MNNSTFYRYNGFAVVVLSTYGATASIRFVGDSGKEKYGTGRKIVLISTLLPF